MLQLDKLSLRKAERGLIIGGSGSGKTTLAEQLLTDFLTRYRTSICLVVDSKPRFRAEHQANGLPAKRIYRRQDHGTTLPGSVRVTSEAELDLALKTGARLVIAQDPNSHRGDKDPDVALLTRIISRFLATARAKIPRLVYVDETLDFYTVNGQAARGTTGAILRCARAGRELGVSLLLASQRVKGIPIQLKTELVRLYLFRMDYLEDVDGLRDCGAPAEILDTPTRDHLFRYWTKHNRGDVFGPYRLELRETKSA